MQFALFLKWRYKENRERNDLPFRHQSDQEKININVSGFRGIDHLDNHWCFQAVASKKKTAFLRLAKLLLDAFREFL